jgi:hypothetical protein
MLQFFQCHFRAPASYTGHVGGVWDLVNNSLVGASVAAGTAPAVAVDEGLPIHAVGPAVHPPGVPGQGHPGTLAPLREVQAASILLYYGGLPRTIAGGLALASAAGLPRADTACQWQKVCHIP